MTRKSFLKNLTIAMVAFAIPTTILANSPKVLNTSFGPLTEVTIPWAKGYTKNCMKEASEKVGGAWVKEMKISKGIARVRYGSEEVRQEYSRQCKAAGAYRKANNIPKNAVLVDNGFGGYHIKRYL